MLHLSAYLLLDPADIERVLVSDHAAFGKPSWLRTAAVRRLLGHGLVAAEGEEWRRQRQACRPAFIARRTEGYGEQIVVTAERMLADWRSGDTRDLQSALAKLTLDIVAHTLMGVDAPECTDSAGRAMETLMARFTARRTIFGMAPWPATPHEILATRQLNRAAMQLVESNPTSGCPRTHGAADPDLLTLIRHSELGGKPARSTRRLRDQVKTFLAAGHESSALALTWALLLLHQNPQARALLDNELDSVLADRALLSDDLPNLPYTRAVIQETLRLYPPLWMTGREALRDCELSGVSIRAGSLIMTSQWAMHRMARYFCEPDQFRPERWINGETKALPRCAYFPFGAGPRVCIGQSFALTESMLLLAAIACRFHLDVVGRDDIHPLAEMTLRPSRRVMVDLHDR